MCSSDLCIAKIFSSFSATKLNTHQVLNCSNKIIKDHCFWPLISDLMNIISHKPVALMFMEDSILLDVWFELISFLQGKLSAPAWQHLTLRQVWCTVPGTHCCFLALVVVTSNTNDNVEM